MSVFNLADLWEQIAREYPDADAVGDASHIRSWAEFDDRAARMASALGAAGIGHDDKVALYLYNGNEYLEAQYAAFKNRAVPCNVNYRYLVNELTYLLTNADAKAVFFDSTLIERVLEAAPQCTDLTTLIQVGGELTPEAQAAGVLEFEQLIANNEPAEPIARAADDLWFLYTGGTTGNPKAVMWPHSGMVAAMNTYYAALKLPMPQTVEEAMVAVRTNQSRNRTQRMLAAAPLMHGTSGITGLHTLALGGYIDCLGERNFDADELWSHVQERRLTFLTIVGDAFCRPMLEALDRAAAAGTPYELSSLYQVMSSGVIWSTELKQRMLEYRDCTLIDSLGSSEGVGFASNITKKEAAAELQTAKFSAGENTIVITDAGTRVEPGSGEIGKLALTGSIPLGYYKDQKKTDETFPEHFGKRWSIPGDYATIEADGTINLLGRGSVSINSGGEKIYPEEVEEAVKTHPDILDCNAVGVPDEKWGQAVVAVVQMTDGPSADDATIIEHVKNTIARYKAPKHLVRVDHFARSTNGKSDYKWAKKTAYEALGFEE